MSEGVELTMKILIQSLTIVNTRDLKYFYTLYSLNFGVFTETFILFPPVQGSNRKYWSKGEGGWGGVGGGGEVDVIVGLCLKT